MAKKFQFDHLIEIAAIKQLGQSISIGQADQCCRLTLYLQLCARARADDWLVQGLGNEIDGARF